MAQIFSFPDHASMHRDRQPARPEGVPDAVWHAVLSVHGMPMVEGVQFHEVPVPRSIAEYGIGVGIVRAGDTAQTGTWPADRGDGFCRHPGHGDAGFDAPADVHRIVDETAWGWITLLYSSDPPRHWGSRWRCAAFCRIPASAGHEYDTDARYTAHCWEAVNAILREAGADASSIAGTVTVSRDTFFGVAPNDLPARYELRASWTPPAAGTGGRDGVDAGIQVTQWAKLIAQGID